MPVENTWLLQDRVLLTRLSGEVTIEELVARSQEGTLLIDSGTAPVYSLVDITRIGEFPAKLNDLKVVFEQGTSPKLTWMIIFGIRNRFLSFFATLFTQFVGRNYKVVDTLEEALAFVEKLEGITLEVSVAES